MSKEYEYDFFISHASEDKDAIARPLTERLRVNGYTVWFDEYEFTLGDSLLGSIDAGLASSRFGIVILSKAFFAKHWPRRELDGLVALERDGRKVILPVWHEVNQEYVSRYSPILAGRLAIATNRGLPEVVAAIEKASSKDKEDPRQAATPGASPVGQTLLLLGPLSEHRLEDFVFNRCSQHGKDGILRALEMEFSALKRSLVDRRNVSRLVGDSVQEELLSAPAEAVARASRNAFAVRVGLAAADVSDLDQEIGEDLFDLHLALFNREDSSESILKMQAAIGSAAYACGAYAIMKNLPKLANSLLGRFNPADVRGGRQWFRYLQIELQRGAGDMINQVRSGWESSEYFLDVCAGSDKALNFLCQFDFLQCAHLLASGRHYSECYPSFCAFRRHTVQPIVEILIHTATDGLWMPAISHADLARIVHELEKIAEKCAGFERPEWGIDRWSSPIVQLFLADHGFEAR